MLSKWQETSLNIRASNLVDSRYPSHSHSNAISAPSYSYFAISTVRLLAVISNSLCALLCYSSAWLRALRPFYDFSSICAIMRRSHSSSSHSIHSLSSTSMASLSLNTFSSKPVVRSCQSVAPAPSPWSMSDSNSCYLAYSDVNFESYFATSLMLLRKAVSSNVIFGGCTFFTTASLRPVIGFVRKEAD